MRRAFLLLLVIVGPAVAAPALASIAVVHPDWIVKPSADTLSRYYPDAAQRKGIGGTATISCPISAVGRLHDCRVLAETPPGMGFGTAAMAASATFRMSPERRAGKPVDAEVVIPITFNRPAKEPWAAPWRAASVINPDWVRKPSEDELARYYPADALKKNLGGHVRIQCLLADDGVLTKCTVLSETPPGSGFGQAALDVSSRFQMRPKVADGKRVQSSIIVPITFAPPDVAASGVGPRPWWQGRLRDVALLIWFIGALRFIWAALRRHLANGPAFARAGSPPVTGAPASGTSYASGARSTFAPFAADIISGRPVGPLTAGSLTFSKPDRRGLGPISGPVALFCALLVGAFSVLVLFDVTYIAPVRDDVRQVYRPRPAEMVEFKIGDHGSTCGRYRMPGDPKAWRFVGSSNGVRTEGKSSEWRNPAASAKLEAEWRACESYRPLWGDGPDGLSMLAALWIENQG